MKKLISLWGSTENVFKESTNALKKINGVGDFKLKNIQSVQNLKVAKEELKKIQYHNIQPLSYLEDSYPPLLKNCIDSPLLLFQYGDFIWLTTN